MPADQLDYDDPEVQQQIKRARAERLEKMLKEKHEQADLAESAPPPIPPPVSSPPPPAAAAQVRVLPRGGVTRKPVMQMFLTEHAPCLDETMRPHLEAARKNALVLKRMTDEIRSELPNMRGEEAALVVALGMSVESIVTDLRSAMMRAQALGDLVRHMRNAGPDADWSEAVRAAVHFDAHTRARPVLAPPPAPAPAPPPAHRPQLPPRRVTDWSAFIAKPQA